MLHGKLFAVAIQLRMLNSIRQQQARR